MKTKSNHAADGASTAGDVTQTGESHLVRLNRLLQVSEQVLAETTMEGLLRRIVVAGCELTGSSIGGAGYTSPDRAFQWGVAVRIPARGAAPIDSAVNPLKYVQDDRVYSTLWRSKASLRMTDEALRHHPDWHGLPAGHPPIHGFLGASLVDRAGRAQGVLMVSAKWAEPAPEREGCDAPQYSDYTAEDEALLAQLASLASLGIQHIQARSEAERRADELATVFNRSARLASTLEAVLQQMPAGVIVREAPSQKPLLTNQQAMDLLGVKTLPEDLSADDVPYQMLLPDGRACPVEQWPIMQAMASGETVSDMEIDLLRADGVQVRLLQSAAPIRDHAGQTIAVASLIYDITKRKEMERALAQREASLQAALKALAEAHDELEQRVQERTAALRVTNEALRAEIELRQSEMKARVQSETRLRKVLETLPVGVWVIDQMGRIMMVNPAGKELWAAVGYTPLGQELKYRGRRPDSDRLIAAEEWGTARALRYGETSLDDEIELECFDGTRKVVSHSAAPLLDEQGQTTGAIAVCEDITRRKATEQVLALQSQRLQILHEIDQAVLAAHSATEIAQAAVRRIRQLVPCQCADVVVFAPSSAGQVSWLAVDAATQTSVVPGLQVPLADYPVVSARPGNEHIVTDLAAQAQRLPVEEMMLAGGMRAYASLPLVTGEQVIGALNLWQDAPGGFARELIEMARQVADSLAVAIQNDRLNHEVDLGRQQLQNLSRRLVEVQESERRYISRELHDEAGQALTTLMVGLKLLERDLGRCTPEVEADLEDIKQVAGAVMEELHGLAVNLRPVSLDKLGLVPALRQLVTQFKRQHNLVVESHLVALEGVRLPLDVETTLYRIVQEALTNIARHAHAGNVGIVLSRFEDHVTAIIEDDGAGFDSSAALQRDRLGLVGMRERAEMLGGTLTVESMPGAGTTVFIDVPCASWQT